MRRTQAHIVHQSSEDCRDGSRVKWDCLRAASAIRTDFGQFAQNTKARQIAAPRNSMLKMAGSTGLEPATSGLTVQCANQAAPRARLGDLRRLHDAFPDCNLRRRRTLPLHRVADAFPFWSARHTRSARSGMSRWRTPRCLRASITAFTMAGVEPMVAASPIPLAPMGLNGVGVTVSSVVNMGRSPAWGTA